MAKEKKNDNKTSSEKESKIKGVVNFLSGKSEEQLIDTKKVDTKVEFPGFFDFVIKRWWNLKNTKKKAQEEKPKGLVKQVGGLFSDYQKAKEEEVEKLNVYESIKQSARFSKEFLVLLSGSCLIATFGLFEDSSAVIIGAMLIAPLMMPILGFSLGTIWGDMVLLKRSLLTLFIGSAFVLMIAYFLTWAIPAVGINAQIKARVNPNLYDIFIALASGFVGAYAYVNPKISPSISGVAISVALMPPLCVIGISLGLGDMRAVIGSSLLYLTNLISIALAASLVFWRLKIHPVSQSHDDVKVRAKRKVVLASIMLLLIAVPLGYFMRETFILKQRQTEIRNIFTNTIKNVTIINLKIEKYPESHEVKSLIVLPKSANISSLNKVRANIKELFSDEVNINIVTLGTTHLE